MMRVVGSVYYCWEINLFTPDPHLDSCCLRCLVHISEDNYREHCWFPNGEIREDISFTIDGEHFLTYYPSITAPNP